MAMATALPRRHLVSLALALTLGATLVGCGGDEKVPSAAEDNARAGRVIFTEADFPDLVRNDEEEEDDASDPFLACLGDNPVLTELGDGPRSAESTFNNDDESLVRSSAVNFAESNDAAETAFDVLQQPAFRGCFENAIRLSFDDELEAGTEASNLSVTDLAVDSEADETAGYRVTVDLGSGEESIGLSFDYVFLRVGRGIAGMFAFDVEENLDDAERERMVTLLSERLEEEV